MESEKILQKISENDIKENLTPEQYQEYLENEKIVASLEHISHKGPEHDHNQHLQNIFEILLQHIMLVLLFYRYLKFPIVKLSSEHSYYP